MTLYPHFRIRIVCRGRFQMRASIRSTIRPPRRVSNPCLHSPKVYPSVKSNSAQAKFGNPGAITPTRNKRSDPVQIWSISPTTPPRPPRKGQSAGTPTIDSASAPVNKPNGNNANLNQWPSTPAATFPPSPTLRNKRRNRTPVRGIAAGGRSPSHPPRP